MSVKLPLLVKREPAPRSRSPSPPQPELSQSRPTLKHSKVEQDYENDAQFEEQEEPIQQQPLQTVVCLKKEETPPHGKLQTEMINHKESSLKQSRMKIQELQRQLEEKTKTANDLRTAINDRKKEIKHIGDQVDKDLNKSLLKMTKTNSVNLRDIFSAPPKSTNNKINDLTEELKKVRLTIKKTKGQIQKMSDGLMDAVNILNQERGTDIETKIRSYDEDIRTIEMEKTMLNDELARGNRDFNEQEERHRNEEIGKFSNQLNEILNLQKEQKVKLYQIEKDDILLMQKIKFFQQKQSAIGCTTKRVKLPEKERAKLDEDIKILIKDINDIIDERNRTEIEKKVMVKNLTTEVANLESKNWDLCNKLRDIDSFLLQYYEKKARKKESKQTEKSSQNMEKSASGNIQAQSNYSETPVKPKEVKQPENDKNMNVKSISVEAVLVQKRKSYEFTAKQPQADEISLSDDFLGGKLLIKSIQLTVDEERIYSITCNYINSHENLIRGLVMGSKHLPQKVQKLQLNIDHQEEEVINFIHVGFHTNQHISFLHIVTSSAKEIKWGKIDNLSKSQQKFIKKYESAIMKSKLVSSSPPGEGQNTILCLSGLVFSTVYLSPK